MLRNSDAVGAAPSLTIPGWPVAGPGLLMATFGNVVFMHLDDRMNDATYALYLRALEASLSHRQRDARVAVVYEVPSFSGLRAMSARAAGEVLRRHGDVLKETTACFALASPSMVARAAASTALTVSRLPFPRCIVSTLDAALGFAAGHLADVDAVDAGRRIHQMMSAHRREMRGGALP